MLDCLQAMGSPFSRQISVESDTPPQTGSTDQEFFDLQDVDQTTEDQSSPTELSSGSSTEDESISSVPSRPTPPRATRSQTPRKRQASAIDDLPVKDADIRKRTLDFNKQVELKRAERLKLRYTDIITAVYARVYSTGAWQMDDKYAEACSRLGAEKLDLNKLQ
jgi:hypothetical protein